MRKMEKCRECRYCQHPEWAVLIPGYMICVHPKAGETGRLDLQRLLDDDNHCGKSVKWWESKDVDNA